MNVASAAEPKSNGKLGTFLGTYTPTILTILGVILYLRTGWLVGHQGIAFALLIAVIANAITLITSLSFSAVATNTRVGVGGAYYIVSRSLGVEIGGAIGLPLFLSQAVSVTLYGFGLAEALRFVWPGLNEMAVAVVVVLLVGALAFRGAGVAMKSQLPVLGLVALSLVALTFGALGGEEHAVGATASSGEVPFWVGFAVFFPAVTGVMAGLGLSGDLRDPARSIPRGCILATITGFIVYVGVILLLAVGAGAEALKSDRLVWTRIAPMWLILPGLFGAIFSSAVGSMLGAPRTLQALAGDALAPKRLGRLSGKRDEPVAGLVLSLVIALAAVGLGDLNSVAPVVAMFFLTVYATVNLVAAVETLSGDPSWRPRIKIPWWLSLIGGLGCLGAMFLINPLAATIAIFVEVAIYAVLARKHQEELWGDARRGLYESLLRWVLIRLRRRPMASRSWRPHVLVFANEGGRRLDLVRWGGWFSQGRGVVTVCELIVGDLMKDDIDIRGRRRRLQEVLDRERVLAFAEVDVVRDLVDGITDVAQANGMAGVQSNTIVLGWPDGPDRRVAFLRSLRILDRLQKSVVIARLEPRAIDVVDGRSPCVDVWWGGLERNGDLMLLLAHLLGHNPSWRNLRIRVMSIASDEDAREKTEANLAHLIKEVRIDAEPQVIVKPEGLAVPDVIRAESSMADAVFLGLAVPAAGEEEEYAKRLAKLSDGLETVFFVRNASGFGGELI